MKKQKGFTLVELLIVIAIIAVLAAVATPLALSAISDSKATAVYSEIKSIQTAELTYYVAQGEYPEDFTKLELSGIETGTGNSKNASYTYSSEGQDTRKLGVNVPNKKVFDKVEAKMKDDTLRDGLEITITNTEKNE